MIIKTQGSIFQKFSFNDIQSIETTQNVESVWIALVGSKLKRSEKMVK